MLAGVVLIGLIGLLFAFLGQSGERITRMWIAADVGDDGTARITEVIDYDFGSGDKHGIFRTVPQPSRDDTQDVSVTMDGTKVPFRVERTIKRARIVIGDPAATVTGTHRYRIEYTLPLLGDLEWLAWDAVGTEWQVPIKQVEVHLAAPYAMRSVLCVAGSAGSDDRCAAMEQPRPGQLDATEKNLGKEQGMTLYGHRTAGGGGGAQLPDPPTGPAPAKQGNHVWMSWLWLTGVTLLAAVAVAELLRLAGRERVQGTDGRIRRMDIGRLARSVRPSAAPPAGIGPAQGGILLTDRVRKQHLVGWLLGAGLDGHLRITGVSHPVLRRSSQQPSDADNLTEDVLGALFAKNPDVSLRKYNRQFALAWSTLRRGLRHWRRTGGDGLWVRGGEQARVATLICGALAIAAGVIVVIVTAGDVTVPGMNWRTPIAVGAALAGGGLAALIRAWELRARTARGSELWCQVEAYRRHLAGLGHWDGRDEDLLTAWAVPLEESKSWLAAAERAAKSTGSSASRQAVPEYDHIRWQLALYLPIAAHDARSHSGSSGESTYSGGGYSGGGSSGGVGGGSGGGGGGSW